LRARVQPNWIAPSILPLFCLMLMYWDARWRAGWKAAPHWLLGAMTFGWLAVIPLHDTRLVQKIFGVPLSVANDPLTRVLAWKAMAVQVNDARTDLLKEGKPVFIIASHYGTTSLLSFYIPEAKAGVPEHPMVYCIPKEPPANQFYFWPGYEGRKGENAIFVAPMDRKEPELPPILKEQFKSVTPLGMRQALYKNSVFHWVQLFACRDLQ
jgi:hypothetical protein